VPDSLSPRRFPRRGHPTACMHASREHNATAAGSKGAVSAAEPGSLTPVQGQTVQVRGQLTQPQSGRRRPASLGRRPTTLGPVARPVIPCCMACIRARCNCGCCAFAPSLSAHLGTCKVCAFLCSCHSGVCLHIAHQWTQQYPRHLQLKGLSVLNRDMAGHDGTKGPSNGEWHALCCFLDCRHPPTATLEAIICINYLLTACFCQQAVSRGKCITAACLALCVLQHGGLNNMRQACPDASSLWHAQGLCLTVDPYASSAGSIEPATFLFAAVLTSHVLSDVT